jgi:3-oxoadipate enol-lactonase
MAAYADRYLEQTLTRRVDDADHDALRGAIASMHPQAYLQAAETTFRADLRPSLTGITAPCLVVAGELDEKTPLARSEELVAGIDGATLAVVPAAGHLSCIENPGAFTSTVRGFLHAVDADQVRGAA